MENSRICLNKKGTKKIFFFVSESGPYEPANSSDIDWKQFVEEKNNLLEAIQKRESNR